MNAGIEDREFARAAYSRAEWRKNNNSLSRLDDYVRSEECSAAVARTLLHCHLQDLQSPQYAGLELSDLLVITGKGLHSEGAPVLAAEVPKFLADWGLHWKQVHGNAGRLVLPRAELARWLGAQQKGAQE